MKTRLWALDNAILTWLFDKAFEEERYSDYHNGLKIDMALSGGEMCVCELAASLGLTESAVSHQLITIPKKGGFKGDPERVFI